MKQGIIGTVSRLALGMGALSAAAGVGAGAANAAGFFIQEQSVTGLGRAFAGGAAAADDASTIFFNPAGMTFLKQGEVMVGGSLLIPDLRLRDEGSTIDYPGFRTPLGILNPPPGAISGDGKSNNPYDATLVPSGYVALPVPSTDNRLWVGVGLGAPFGLESQYNSNWFGRYDATKTELQVYNLSPTVAYRVNDWLSIGGGIDISYAWAKLESHVPNPVGKLVPSFSDDGKLSIKGDSWAIGYNIGAIVQPVEGTRLGVHFRSGVDHMLDGRASLKGVNFPPLPGLPAERRFRHRRPGQAEPAADAVLRHPPGGHAPGRAAGRRHLVWLVVVQGDPGQARRRRRRPGERAALPGHGRRLDRRRILLE